MANLDFNAARDYSNDTIKQALINIIGNCLSINSNGNFDIVDLKEKAAQKMLADKVLCKSTEELATEIFKNAVDLYNHLSINKEFDNIEKLLNENSTEEEVPASNKE